MEADCASRALGGKAAESAILPIVRPIRDAAELEELRQAAEADDHRVIGATHIVRKHGRVVGYGSLGGFPVLNCWLDSVRVNARDTLHVLSVAEALLASAGHSHVLLPCDPGSPLKPYVERLGFVPVGQCVMHIKQLA